MEDSNATSPETCQACGKPITGEVHRFYDVPTSAFCSIECQVSKCKITATEVKLADLVVTRVDNRPRPPSAAELAELAAWLQSTGHDPDVANCTAKCASIAVFDGYCTDCPGYYGKLMSVVWSGSPAFFDVFTWADGKIERGGRDYDQHECSRCGKTNGTLCWQLRQS